MSTLAKASLRQLDPSFQEEIERDTWLEVQFNPETLKVNFSNQLSTPSGAGDQNGTPGQLFIGSGSTKLSVQLWFDVTGEQNGSEAEADDVRRLTQKVAFFITPKKHGDKLVPPAARFLWGSFQFDGVMESLEESLEYFSPEGKPLRASVTFSLTQQRIVKFVFQNGPTGPGTRPLTEAPEGSPLQQLAAAQGKGGDWQRIAEANGIEDPRRLRPGQLINMNPSPRRSAR